MDLSKAGEKCFLCKDSVDLIQVGSYYYCVKHQNSVKEKNTKNNGTARHYASMRKSNRKKAAAKLKVSEGALTVVPIETRFEKDPNLFKESLSTFKQLIAGKRVAIWDTECDGKGGTHNLSKVREWCFRGVDTEHTIHIRRYLNDVGYDSNAGTVSRTKNPNYDDQSTSIKIKTFIDNYDYIFAFEPKGCYRNRLKKLFDNENPEWYPAIQDKLKDFSRDCIKSICHTNYKYQEKMIYVTDMCQPTIWEYLLRDKNIKPNYFLETPKE
jgi:hypothetical protein